MSSIPSYLPLLLTRGDITDNINNTLFTLFIIFISSEFYLIKDIIHKYFDILLTLLKIKKNTLEFVCSETKTFYGNGNIKMNATDAFKAICFYIKKNDNEHNVEGLYSLKELTNSLYDYDDNNSKNDLKEIIYIANQTEKFTINTEDNKGIDYRMTKQETDTSSKRGDRDPIGIFSNYKLTISSTSKSTSFLQNHVDNICKQYCEAIELKVLENNYVFIYEGTDNDGQLMFSSYPFETTCNINNFYYNDKKKIINQLDFFKNNKQWYIDRGKPYTLGICTWGKPGCGKTTFEKIVAKYLDRHMIIVDLSKIKTQREADRLFFDPKINNIKIPNNKRLYIFPDVDKMTELIKKKEKHSENQNLKKKGVEINNELETELEEKIVKRLSDLIKKNDIEDSYREYSILPKDLYSKGDTPINFSKILNIIDGVPERTDQIIMMSCNNPENLDKAFLRPGRIDILTEFTTMTNQDLISLLENHYSEKLNEDDKDKNSNKINNKWSPAEVFKVCSQYINIDDAYEQLCIGDPQKVIYPFSD